MSGPVLTGETIGFEGGSLGGGTITGAGKGQNQPPDRPWAPDTSADAACVGNTGLTAGRANDGEKGVDNESTFTVTIPNGATSVEYSYSMSGTHTFEVYVDLGTTLYSGNSWANTGATPLRAHTAATCQTDCIKVSAGGTLHFRCASTGNGETCSIDEIIFYSTSTRRLVTMADDPLTLALPIPLKEKQEKKQPPLIRSKKAIRDLNSDSKTVLLLVMLLVSMLPLMLWRKLTSRAMSRRG